MRGAYEEEATKSLQQAAILLSILPVVLVFLLLQRQHARGLAAGAVKG